MTDDAAGIARKGILPHDGKNIKFADLPAAIRKTYNMSHPFSILLPRQAAQLLNRDPGSDSFDLSDLSVHNMIEHDASFCRTCRLSPVYELSVCGC